MAPLHEAGLVSSQSDRTVCDECRQRKAKCSAMKREKSNRQREALSKQKARIQVFQTFKSKYDYYFGTSGRIKYPIDDKLLFIYEEFFGESTVPPAPTHHPTIPSQLLGDFLELENFLSSFREEIAEFYRGATDKATLFQVMACEGSDPIFEALLSAMVQMSLKDALKNNNPLLSTVESLLELDSYSESCFYSVMPDIISNLSVLKKSLRRFSFPAELNLNTKVATLIALLQSLNECEFFHGMVSRKSEKMAELNREKVSLLSSLKNENAEILSNKEKAKLLSREPEQEESKLIGTVGKLEMEELALKLEEDEKAVQVMKDEVRRISKLMPFAISEVLFLGKDRNHSEYFFFLHEPHRLYVHYRDFVLDEGVYQLYEGRKNIDALLSSLNPKGIHEKQLHSAINELVKLDMIHELPPRPLPMPELKPVQMVFDQTKLRHCIVGQLLDVEEIYNSFLKLKNLCVASEEKRQWMKEQLEQAASPKQLKKCIELLYHNFQFPQFVRTNKKGKEQRKNIAYKILSLNCKAKAHWERLLSESRSLAEMWVWAEIFCNQVTKYVDRNLKDLIKLSERRKRRREAMDESDIIIEDTSERRRDTLRNRTRRCPNANMREPSSSSSASSASSKGEEECQLCGGRETGMAVTCENCCEIYHLKCLKMKRVPAKEWTCMECLEKWATMPRVRHR